MLEIQKEFVMSKQVLRSGTSIGANIREGQRAQSKPDFFSKLNISLKEAEETAYWLELLYEGGYLTKDEFSSIYADNAEIIRLLVSITKKQIAIKVILFSGRWIERFFLLNKTKILYLRKKYMNIMR